MKAQFPKITVWRAIFAAIMLSGLYATYLRVMYGLGGSTNLSDKFPWGIWIGFDVMCGVGLAAGGFTLVAMVHIFNIEQYKPVLRPAILTAFLGYSLVVVGLLFDLGRPDRPGAERGVLAGRHRRAAQPTPADRTRRRGLLGYRVDTSAAGLRLLLRQEAL